MQRAPRASTGAQLPLGRHAFRPEIQALRAVAVGGVVLYHLWPRGLRGGFVGVDVFFVISGFLITQQLADEVTGTGRVSLARFWARRIRRILPAALTVLLACIGLVVAVLPRLAWQPNLSDITAAAAYVENWQLAAHSVDYLAAENSPSLVQHYWSLSLEEQFYLVWPLLVLLAVVLASRVRGARVRGFLAAVLVVAALASFVTSVVWTHVNPTTAFFATPTRAWEFAVGGLVALALPRIGSKATPAAQAVASWVGIALVGCSLFAIGSGDPFPGTIALLPVAGAAVVIAAQPTSSIRWSPARVVQLRFVQWLGDNSYSIYLWHWPLIVAAPWLLHHALSWPAKLLILITSLVLAAATKRLIEDPLRLRSPLKRTPLAYAFAVVGVLALVAVSTSIATQAQRNGRKAELAIRNTATGRTKALVAHPSRRSCFGAAAMEPANHCTRPFARPAHLDTAFAATDGRAEPCLQNFDAATPAPCVLGRARHPTRTVALVGNSHAWRLIPALSLYAEEHGWQLVVVTRINCLGLTTMPVGTGGASANCLRWSSAVQRRLLAMRHLDAVIFASYRYTESFTDGLHPTASEERATAQQILATWSRFRSHGVRVLVTQDVPGMRPSPDPDCIAQSARRYDPCAVPRSRVVLSNLTARLAQQNLALATYLPLDQYFCDPRACHGLIGGVVVYFDAHHLTTTFSRSLAAFLGAEVADALAPRGR